MTRYRRVVTLAVMAAVLGIVPGGTVSAKGPVTVSATVQGMEVTLSVPRVTYPRDALVKVNVRLQNHLNTVVRTNNFFGLCYEGDAFNGAFGASPVLSGSTSGTAVHFPARALQPQSGLPSCTLDAIPIPPGGSLQHSFLVILTGPGLWAQVQLAPETGTIPVTITTSILHLHLIKGTSPRVIMRHPSSSVLSAQVVPAARRHGPLFYNEWVKCPWLPVVNLVNGFVWKYQHSSYLGPQCVPPTEWHVAAGYLNEPVVTIDYSAPAMRPPLRSQRSGLRLIHGESSR